MQRIIDLFSLQKLDLTFSKLDFWIFFLIVMILFSLLHKNKVMRSIYLVAVSLFFYFKTSGLSVSILVFTLIVNYLIGLSIGASKKDWNKKIVLGFGVILNIAVLSYFKYAYFFTNSFNELFHTKYEVFNVIAYFQNGFDSQGTHNIFEKLLLPAGVSFFTFSSIAYIIDVSRKEAQPIKNFFHYSFFISFFPHLILGPIVRAKDFVPQIEKPYSLDKEEFSWAIFQILKGLFKKLILADYIAVHFIDKVVDSPEAYPGFISLVAIVAYSLQIYGDFSGYTDMATGIARLMGFKLQKNFDSPYKSVSTADFWRRWHMSLGSWWKNYLYIPLGGNRTGGFASIFALTLIFVFLFFITQWKLFFFIYIGLVSVYLIILLLFPKYKKNIYRDINLIITMVVGGLWHNPNQNFVIWGALNGIGLVFYNHWKKISPYENSNKWIARVWKIMLTFSFITFTRIWFRVEGKDAPFEFLTNMITRFNFEENAFMLMCSTFAIPLILMIVGYILHWLPDSYEDKLGKAFSKLPLPLHLMVSVIWIVVIYQFIADTSKHFVYFSF